MEATDPETIKAIVNNIVDGVITINNQGIIKSVNKATEKIFGYAVEEMIGQNVKMLMPEPDAGKHDGYINNYERTGNAKIIGKGREVTGKKKSGETFPLFLSISEVVIKEEKIYAGIIHDLSDLKRTEVALQESEDKINSIINAAVDGVITIDNRGLIEMVNPSAARLFGYEAEELIGQNVNILMPEPDRSRHDGYIGNYERTREKKIIGIGREVTAMKKDGSVFPVYLSISEVKLSHRTVYTGFIHDISQQKLREELEKTVAKLENTNRNLQKAEKEIRKALTKEKELNELKSRFVTIASHEFRTPLSTILSSASLISKYKSEQDDDKRFKHVERIKSAVHNLKTILDDFLSISKIEEGKVYNLPSSFNLVEFCQDVVEEIQLMSKEGQKITYIHMSDDDNVHLDKQLLKNILINLLSNAIKYSSEGKNIILSTEISGPVVKISVKDEGIGIPETDKEHLFNPFFRAQNASNIQGTGLGLHIVKKYVSIMGGTMDYTSELNKGTTFNVLFLK